MNDIASASQRLGSNDLVTLYTLDSSMLTGGSIFYFTSSVLDTLIEPQMLLNSCLKANGTGWTFGGTASPSASGSATAAGLTDWALDEVGSGYMRRASGLTTGQNMTATTTNYATAFVGSNYEFSALVQPHRCRVKVQLVFYNSSNAVISTLSSDTTENASAPSIGNYEGAYTRLYVRGIAPASTASIRGIIFVDGIAGGAATDPYCYFSKVFLGGPIPTDAVGPTEWVPFSNTGRVYFGGTMYTPVPIETDGFEWSGRGPMPRPRIRITNIGNLAGTMAIQTGDLLGAKLTRIRTYARYLDGMPEADSTTMFEPDIWYFERKSVHNPTLIEWELSSVLDQDGRKLPGRQMLRDVCSHTYRYFVPGVGLSYTGVTCPYTDTRYFTENGVATGDSSLDKCGKRLQDCAARFAAVGLPLPTRAFPGMSVSRNG